MKTTTANFLPISKLAEKFGVSDITIYRTFQSKEVHRKRVEGTWQYNVGEFQAYYNANKERILEKQKRWKQGNKAKKTAATKASNKAAVAPNKGQLSSDLITVQQAAEKFGVNPARLYYYVEHKQLSVMKRKQGKRKVAYVNPADVQAVLQGKKGVGKVVAAEITGVKNPAVRKALENKTNGHSNGNGHTVGLMMRLDLDANAVAFLGALIPQRPFTLTKANAEALRAVSHINPDAPAGLNKIAVMLEQGHTLVLDQVQ